MPPDPFNLHHYSAYLRPDAFTGPTILNGVPHVGPPEEAEAAPAAASPPNAVQSFLNRFKPMSLDELPDVRPGPEAPDPDFRPGPGARWFERVGR